MRPAEFDVQVLNSCTYIINFTDESPSWEANSHLASQKIPRPFKKTVRFTAVFITVRHWPLFWVRCIQSTIFQ